MEKAIHEAALQRLPAQKGGKPRFPAKRQASQAVWRPEKAKGVAASRQRRLGVFVMARNVFGRGLTSFHSLSAGKA